MAQNPQKKWTLKEQQTYIEEHSKEQITLQAIAYRMKRV